MDNNIGYLNREGILYECESYEHLDKAACICESLNIPVDNRLDAEAKLLNMGWIAIRARDAYGLIGYIDDNEIFTENPKII